MKRVVSGAAMVLAGSAAAAHADVRVAQGLLHGRTIDKVAVYRAIPYGAPPVGALRFRPAQPPQAWTGVRDAVDEGPSCPQINGPGGDPAGKSSTDEDCLRLNLFTPAAKAKALRPVVVWIHGGGFNGGFAGARQYDLSPLVKEGGIVAVSINYRMGAFGLLATRSLDQADGEPSGGNALRDQQAALRWVQKNIAAFGGDPKAVTIAGESAGAASVLALVASPKSKGLFVRAIAQSPPDDTHAWTRARMEKTGEDIADKLGCKADADQAACLRKLPADAILKVRGRLGLIEDPQVLPLDPFDAFKEGKFNRVPLLIGSNLHEAYFQVAGAERGLGHAMSEDEYVTAARARLYEEAEGAMKAYPPKSAPSPAAALGDAMSDIVFSCSAHMARAGASNYVPVYGYEMNEPDPAQQQPRPKISLANTSYHTSDLAYLFDYVTSGPLEGDAARLGKRMRAYWIQFIKTGSPNARGLPNWPRFGAKAPALLELSNQGGVTSDFAMRHRCDELQKLDLISTEMK